MTEIAKTKAAECEINNIHFERATIFENNFTKDNFDVILALNLLHGLDNIQKVIEKIYVLLKPDGLFLSSTPCLAEKMSFGTRFQFSIFHIFSKTGLIPFHVKKFKFSELKSCIIDGSFQLIDSEILFQNLSSYFIVAKKPNNTGV